MGVRQMWREHRQHAQDKQYINELLTRGMERFDGSGPEELAQIKDACERVAAKSHGGTKTLAASMTRQSTAPGSTSR